MLGQHSIRDFDWLLISLALAISTLGVLEIYSATRNTLWQDAHYRQILWIICGLVLMWVFSIIEYSWMVKHAYLFYVVGVVLLTGVALFGQVVGGAKRWIALPSGAGRRNQF